MEAINQLSETKLISLDITEAKRAVASVVCNALGQHIRCDQNPGWTRAEFTHNSLSFTLLQLPMNWRHGEISLCHFICKPFTFSFYNMLFLPFDNYWPLKPSSAFAIWRSFSQPKITFQGLRKWVLLLFFISFGPKEEEKKEVNSSFILFRNISGYLNILLNISNRYHHHDYSLQFDSTRVGDPQLDYCWGDVQCFIQKQQWWPSNRMWRTIRLSSIICSR
jgi:hypothetical protein